MESPFEKARRELAAEAKQRAQRAALERTKLDELKALLESDRNALSSLSLSASWVSNPGPGDERLLVINQKRGWFSKVIPVVVRYYGTYALYDWMYYSFFEAHLDKVSSEYSSEIGSTAAEAAQSIFRKAMGSLGIRVHG